MRASNIYDFDFDSVKLYKFYQQDCFDDDADTFQYSLHDTNDTVVNLSIGGFWHAAIMRYYECILQLAVSETKRIDMKSSYDVFGNINDDDAIVCDNALSQIQHLERLMKTVAVFFMHAHNKSRQLHPYDGFIADLRADLYSGTYSRMANRFTPIHVYNDTLFKYHQRLYLNFLRWGYDVDRVGQFYTKCCLVNDVPIMAYGRLPVPNNVIYRSQKIVDRISRARGRIAAWFRCIRLLAQLVKSSSAHLLRKQVVCRLVLQHTYQALLPQDRLSDMATKFSTILNAMSTSTPTYGPQWMTHLERSQVPGFRTKQNECLDVKRLVWSAAHTSGRMSTVSDEHMPSAALYYRLSDRWVFPYANSDNATLFQ